MARSRRPPTEPSLFDPPPVTTAGEADPAERLAAEHQAAAILAARLPDTVRFGTSSWSFPGWAGLVYSRKASEATLAREGLSEYGRHPLLRTVGIDRGFYAPIPERDLERYASQLPAGFPVCAKAAEAVTSPVRLDFAARRPAEANPDYLRPERFLREMVEPFLRRMPGNLGPFLLQFPPPPRGQRLAPEEFAARLDSFLAALPGSIRVAVELRDPAHLGPAYRSVLAARGAAHAYNYAARMPSIEAQAAIVPPDQAPFTVVRLLLRAGSRYAERKEAFAPFDRLVEPDEAMRDQMVRLMIQAVAARRPAFVLINNKAEGSAPLTVRALAERLAVALEAGKTAG